MASGTPSFNNLRVAALESRNAAEIARLIEKFGGRPFVSRRGFIGSHAQAGPVVSMC